MSANVLLYLGFPGLPLFTHSLFCQADWQSFASAVRLHHENDQVPRSLLIQQAVPEISHVLHSVLHTEAMNHNVTQQQLATLTATVNTLASTVNTLASSDITISFPHQLTGRFTQSKLEVSVLFFCHVYAN